MIPFTQLDPVDVENQTQILADWLSEFMPSADTSQGTVYRELLLRPAAAAASSHIRAEESLRNSLSLSWAIANPDAADPAIVAALAGNYDLQLRPGAVASGVLRVSLSSPLRLVLPASTEFYFGDTRFISTSRVVSTETPVNDDDVQIIQVDHKDATGQIILTTYDFVVPVVASEIGVSGNLVAGTRLFSTGVIPQVIEVTVYSDLTGGQDAETLPDLISRIQIAIANKSLSSKVHIAGLLQGEFPDIQALQVVGACQSEMQRDRVNLLGVSTGGKVDLYVRTSTLPVLEFITAKAYTIPGDRLFSVHLDYNEACGVVSIQSLSTKAEVTNLAISSVTWDYQSPSTDVPTVQNAITARFSRYQTADIVFQNIDPTFTSGSTVYVGVHRIPLIDQIQNFLLDHQNMGADFLARTPIPCYVSPIIQLKVPSGVDINTEAIKESIAATINRTQFNNYGLSLAAIIASTFQSIPSSVQVVIPPQLDVAIYLTSGQTINRHIVQDLNPNDLCGISNRLVAYFCWPSSVIINTEPLV